MDLLLTGRETRLYRNNGSGNFVDTTSQARVKVDSFIKAGVFGGLNNNGCLDLYLSSTTQDYLYQNQCDVTFLEIIQSAGLVEENYEGRGVAIADYDNDGLVDLFIATDYGVSPLYFNLGNGQFTDATKNAGLCRNGTGMGVATGDYNNNGYIDIYM